MCKRFLLKKGAIISRITIKPRLNSKINGMGVKTICLLLFLLFSLTNLEMATGNPREHNVINRLKVGRIRE